MTAPPSARTPVTRIDRSVSAMQVSRAFIPPCNLSGGKAGNSRTRHRHHDRNPSCALHRPAAPEWLPPRFLFRFCRFHATPHGSEPPVVAGIARRRTMADAPIWCLRTVTGRPIPQGLQKAAPLPNAPDQDHRRSGPSHFAKFDRQHPASAHHRPAPPRQESTDRWTTA
jgi:hypothetical protein